MPSYAILGATGNVGTSLVTTLLESKTNRIQAFVRSKDKLHKVLPQTADNKQIQVFEGGIDNVKLLSDCLRGTQAAFLAVAIKGNQPGCSIAQDTGHAVIKALERLQGERLPRLIVLSSSSTEHRMLSAMPGIARSLIYKANSNIYHDLEAAESFLRSKSAFVSCTFVKPGALTHDARKGHILDFETSNSPLSYADLAAGMLEIAEDGTDVYDEKSVSVNSIGRPAIPWQSAQLLFFGLLIHFFPWLWPYLGKL